MKVIAWSENLTRDRAEQAGAELVSKEELLRRSDVLTVHLILSKRRIAAAALDVFDVEPLPECHPFRTLDNVLATPHVGYVSRNLYRTFYGDTVASIAKWLDSRK